MQFVSIDSLLVGWFDLIVLAVLVTGALVGRKRGMSEELLPLARSVAIVILAALFYQPLGKEFEKAGNFSALASYIAAYFACVLGVFIVFSLLKRVIGGKPISSERFGKSEYYLGVCAGIVHAGCILIVALAFLNARGYTQKELQERRAYVMDVYGSDFFPGLDSIQTFVFQDSLVGSTLKHFAGGLFIKSTVPEKSSYELREWHMDGATS